MSKNYTRGDYAHRGSRHHGRCHIVWLVAGTPGGEAMLFVCGATMRAAKCTPLSRPSAVHPLCAECDELGLAARARRKGRR